jgi:hypothetical protein
LPCRAGFTTSATGSNSMASCNVKIAMTS